EKRVFLVILFTSFSGSLVSRIPGAVQKTFVTQLLKTSVHQTRQNTLKQIPIMQTFSKRTA
ncbi:hypothetical protein OSK11_25425, partial [Escherichia coli]|nr:hypothetical protein [Escherichia coli]MDA6322850.1 hypothetical protein [Escherichia coli]